MVDFYLFFSVILELVVWKQTTNRGSIYRCLIDPRVKPEGDGRVVESLVMTKAALFMLPLAS